MSTHPLPDYLRCIADDMAALDRVIRTGLDSDVVLVREISEYIITNGGKRLRPMLVLLAAKAVGYSGQDHITLAAVVEMIHTATLLHDDVVDESALRRGQATANARFGNAASVLVGDFIYSRSFQWMVEVGNLAILRVLSFATNVIAEGEVLQLMNCHDSEVDEARYLKVIHYKTARLFAAAAEIGAIVGESSATAQSALASYGEHLGAAFQLIDDVLDYSGDQATIGKNPGDDLAEGKPTLPLIYALQRADSAERDILTSALLGDGRAQFSRVLAIITSLGALAATRERARYEAESAISALAPLPASLYREALVQLALAAAGRTQ